MRVAVIAFGKSREVWRTLTPTPDPSPLWGGVRGGGILAQACLTLLFLAITAAQALAADPFARLVVHGDQPVKAGQQVKVDLQIFAPNFFMSAPQFPLFDMPGAIVTMPDDSGLNLSETVDGQDFAGIQKTYVITPLGGGELTFPPVEIGFRYASEPGKPADGKITLPAEKISVEVPPGAVGPNGPLPMARLTVSQSLDRDAAGLKVGDALVRTIDTKAEGMPAMMIPPPDFSAPDGVRVYHKDPRLSDGDAGRQGFKEGERLDTVTYVFEQPGDFVLPAVSIDWFDTGTNSAVTAKADEIKVSVAPAAATTAIAPEQPAEAAPAPPPVRWQRPAAIAAAVILLGLVVFWLVRRLGPPLRARREERRQFQANSEATRFEEVRQAFAAGDRKTIYAAIDRWARRAGFASIADGARGGDAELAAGLQRLERSLFGPAPETGPLRDDDLLARLTALRSSLPHARRTVAVAPALPPLNPQVETATSPDR